MDKQQAQTIIKEVFEKSFNKDRFNGFIKNLLNQIEDAPFSYQGNYIPDAYKSFISRYERLGKYNDGEKRIDILIVYLNRKTSIERARTSQRNFIAGYLDGKYGSDVSKDAALVAFVSPKEEDWRFSLVKMDYRFEQAKNGKIKVKEEFTPARRWSFLVGKNESSHTAQSRLVPRLADDEHNPTLTQMEEAFNIEKVTKEFFGKYRELFLWTKETLDKIVERDTKIKADFEKKSVNTIGFAKKLLGQVVFLYFLQKKGWFGVKRGEKWGSGSKHFLRELFEKKHSDYKNFFNNILEPLFYEALRQDRSHDKNYYSRFDCRIPFLNGGLFDPINDYDWVNTDIELPSELFSNQNKTKQGDIGNGILDIFDRYNFTVKEDEPLEKEVAVDPEMLGKVFENLLEVKDRKSKGTYYTPREIVHYMCQQSLINYLNTELNKGVTLYQNIGDIQTNAFGNETKVGQLDLTVKYKSGTEITKQDIETLIKYGEQFGENEATVEVRGKETDTYFYKLSESIRRNAKLIDEKLAIIKICDPAIGSGAFPVGMMHEIVKTRNVLSAFIKDSNRTIYNFKRQCIENSLYGVDIDPGAVEIAKLRLWLSLVVDEEDIKQIKPLPNLDYKIVCGNSLLGVEKNLFNNELFAELELLKPLLFNETNPTRKQNYKQQIDALISQITNGHKEFDFEVYFSEVFHKKGGFDVVIANPPYMTYSRVTGTNNKNSEDDKQYKKTLIKLYPQSAEYKISIYAIFINLGVNLLKNNGSLCYITPETFLLGRYFSKLRKFILNECKLDKFLLFGQDFWKSGTVGLPTISFIIKYNNVRTPLDYNFAAIFCPSLSDFEKHNVLKFEYPYDYFNNTPYNRFRLFFRKGDFDLAEKIEKNCIEAEQIIEMHVGVRPKIGYAKIQSAHQLSEKWRKGFVKGSEIFRYYSRWAGRYINIDPKLLWGGGFDERIVNKGKLLMRKTGNELIVALDFNAFYHLDILHSIILKNRNFDLRYLASLFNSSCINYYYKLITLSYNRILAQINIETIERIPIKEIFPAAQQPFINLVDRILAITKDEDYPQNPQKQSQVRALEQEIDQMVYELYGLTEEEIGIVEREAQ